MREKPLIFSFLYNRDSLSAPGSKGFSFFLFFICPLSLISFFGVGKRREKVEELGKKIGETSKLKGSGRVGKKEGMYTPMGKRKGKKENASLFGAAAFPLIILLHSSAAAAAAAALE